MDRGLRNPDRHHGDPATWSSTDPSDRLSDLDYNHRLDNSDRTPNNFSFHIPKNDTICDFYVINGQNTTVNCSNFNQWDPGIDGIISTNYSSVFTSSRAFVTSHQSATSLWRSSANTWQVLPLFLIVLAGIMGNVLVCMAVATEKKLQNVTNYFLTSLAVADLFVCCAVMPLSIISEFMGLWPLGLAMCTLWQVTDVMMCTSSIMHMCVISLDRYITMRNPLSSRIKSRTNVAIKMAAVWIISLATASPIIVLSILRPQDILNSEYQCGIFNQYFLISGSLTAFFIPLTIMMVAYTLTIMLLNKQAKQCRRRGSDGMRRTRSRRKFFNKNPTPSQAKPDASPLNGYRAFQGSLRKPSLVDADTCELEPLRGHWLSDRKASNISNITVFTTVSRSPSRVKRQSPDVAETRHLLHPNVSYCGHSYGGEKGTHAAEKLPRPSENDGSFECGISDGNGHISVKHNGNLRKNSSLSDSSLDSNVLQNSSPPYMDTKSNLLSKDNPIEKEQAENEASKHDQNSNHKPLCQDEAELGKNKSNGSPLKSCPVSSAALKSLLNAGVTSQAVRNNSLKAAINSQGSQLNGLPSRLDRVKPSQQNGSPSRQDRVKPSQQNGSPSSQDRVKPGQQNSSPSRQDRVKLSQQNGSSSSQDRVKPSQQNGSPSSPDRAKPSHQNGSPSRQDRVKPSQQNGSPSRQDRVKPSQQNGSPSRHDGVNPSQQNGSPSSHDRVKPSQQNGSPSSQEMVKPSQQNGSLSRQDGVKPSQNTTQTSNDSSAIKQRLLSRSQAGATAPTFRDLVHKHQAAFKIAGILMAKREEKNTVKTEQKAIKVLGTMFAIFVLCWAPFFTINFTIGLCSNCDIKLVVFKIFLWLGYFGSTLNPIIYTVFNKNFRRFFASKLTCGRYAPCSPRPQSTTRSATKTTPKTAAKTNSDPPKTNSDPPKTNSDPPKTNRTLKPQVKSPPEKRNVERNCTQDTQL